MASREQTLSFRPVFSYTRGVNQVQALLQSHPQWPAVETIYHRLQAHGYKAFLAGGCVRDALLGREANDLDVATDASPDEVEKIFEKTVNVGKSFGVMRVLLQGADLEVATFRNDGNYKDGRRPENVSFSTPEEDAQRRDFTVNALFYDLKSHQVWDFVHGQEDLRAGVLRTVGEPQRRFEEDHLRLLRAARFAAQLNFVIEPKSFAALKQMAPAVASVSGERIRDEMIKLLKNKTAMLGLDVMAQSGLMAVLFPFRLRDNHWSPSELAQESWHYLALFLRKADSAELQKSLELLKLSTRERRSMEEAWMVWQNPMSLLELSLGKKLQRMAREGVVFALQVLRQEGYDGEQIAELFQAWQQWQEVLPRPLLTGDDVQGRLVGKAIGLCLEKAYELQLERVLITREEALLWLKNYLERESQ